MFRSQKKNPYINTFLFNILVLFIFIIFPFSYYRQYSNVCNTNEIQSILCNKKTNELNTFSNGLAYLQNCNLKTHVEFEFNCYEKKIGHQHLSCPIHKNTYLQKHTYVYYIKTFQQIILTNPTIYNIPIVDKNLLEIIKKELISIYRFYIKDKCCDPDLDKQHNLKFIYNGKVSVLGYFNNKTGYITNNYKCTNFKFGYHTLKNLNKYKNNKIFFIFGTIGLGFMISITILFLILYCKQLFINLIKILKKIYLLIYNIFNYCILSIQSFRCGDMKIFIQKIFCCYSETSQNNRNLELVII